VIDTGDVFEWKVLVSTHEKNLLRHCNLLDHPYSVKPWRLEQIYPRLPISFVDGISQRKPILMAHTLSSTLNQFFGAGSYERVESAYSIEKLCLSPDVIGKPDLCTKGLGRGKKRSETMAIREKLQWLRYSVFRINYT
jgi:hypothetical protein